MQNKRTLYFEKKNLQDAQEARLAAVRPSARQMHIQALGFYAFFHFGMNTFTGREWGDGTDSPALFDPKDFDAGAWARSIKAAGMKGAILTCKHHDGFCLWPSAYTDYSVKSAPWKFGEGDVVREVSDALRAEGLAFGVYLSPWDRHEKSYGSGQAYNDYFVNQLTELLSGYGPLFCVWFDGACGEGANGRKQDYDWARYYETIRRLQPSACISVTGPDVRWCGNEAGCTRAAEWSVVSARLSMAERIAAASQQTDDAQFRAQGIASGTEDLGSRAALLCEPELIWYPAEVDVSIRSGWFYHADEDKTVKSAEQLFDLWLRAVGGNSMLLLNIPPMPNGLISAVDVEALRGLGALISARFARRLDAGAQCRICYDDERLARSAVVDASSMPCVTTKEQRQSALLSVGWRWQEAQRPKFLVLGEDIEKGQRVERFSVWAEDESGALKCVHRGSVIGYKTIVALPETKTSALEVRIEEARGGIALRCAEVY